MGAKPKSNLSNRKSHPAFRAALIEWYRREGRDLPWRRDVSAYAVLVSELMLQQTQVATVIAYFERWMRRFPDFSALAAARESEVLAVWQGLGYYARARNLHRAARLIVEHHGGVLPEDDAALRALPGVGAYTAGALAAFAFDRPAVAVDANIARVLARLGDIRAPIDERAGRKRLHALAAALLPAAGGREYTSALMELGALVCAPKKPECLVCPVRVFCAAAEPEALPKKRPRARIVDLDETCAWHLRRGALLLEVQSGLRWRGLWKLPRCVPPLAAEPLLTTRYPFTNHRVTLRIFAGDGARAAGDGLRWVKLGALEDFPLAAPHRRAIRVLLSRAAGAC